MKNSKNNILDEMKFDKIFIDEKSKINFNDFYLQIIPEFNTLGMNNKEIININYNNNHLMKISKINIYFCNIELYIFDNPNKNIKKFQYVFLKPLYIFYKSKKIEIAYLQQFDDIPGLLNIKFPILFCYNDYETMDYNINFLITHLRECKSDTVIELFDKEKL